MHFLGVLAETGTTWPDFIVWLMNHAWLSSRKVTSIVWTTVLSVTSKTTFTQDHWWNETCCSLYSYTEQQAACLQLHFRNSILIQYLLSICLRLEYLDYYYAYMYMYNVQSHVACNSFNTTWRKLRMIKQISVYVFVSKGFNFYCMIWLSLD